MITTLLADLQTGKIQQATLTLSASPETESTLTLPDWARRLRLYPSADVRFALNEAPAASGASLAAGGIAKAGEWDTRLLAKKPSRVLHLKSATASATVDVEVAG